MKKLLFMIAALCLVASVGYCQEQANIKVAKTSPLTLTIKSDKQVYEVGEEINLTFTWKNNGSREVQIYFREDSLLQRMLSVVGKHGKAMPKKIVMFEFATSYKPKIPPGGEYVHQLKGRFAREDEKDVSDWQKMFGDLILTFDGKTLSEIPLVLGETGKFQLALLYEMPADAYLVKSEPDTWAGEISSNTITIEVKEKKT